MSDVLIGAVHDAANIAEITFRSMLMTGPLVCNSAGESSLLTFEALETGGGADTITAAQLIGGYSYVGDPGGNVALTLPGAAATATELATRGVTAAAGLTMPLITIANTNGAAATLTVTAAAAADETIIGTAAIPAGQEATVKYVFTAAGTASVVIVLGA